MCVCVCVSMRRVEKGSRTREMLKYALKLLALEYERSTGGRRDCSRDGCVTYEDVRHEQGAREIVQV